MSSSSIVHGSIVDIPSMIPIVEEAPEVVLRPVPMNPLRKKHIVGQIVVPKKRFKVSHDVEASRSGSMTILLGYIPPRKDDATEIKIPKNARCQLVAPTIPKVVWVTQNILANLKKMTFVDHDLQKFPDLAMNKYMVSIKDTKDGPMHTLQMERAR